MLSKLLTNWQPLMLYPFSGQKKAPAESRLRVGAIKYAWSKGIAASGQDLDQKTPIRDCIWWVILPGEKVV